MKIETRGVIVPAGWTIIASKAYSQHPDDGHLSVVLCRSQHRDEWVTWLGNSSCGGCGNGHYFRDAEDALTDYVRRRA